VNDASGYWTFKHLNHGDTPLLVAGHYTGLQLYSREANRYQLLRSIKGFTESSRFVETDGPFIWISHPYRGIYRVDSRTDSVMLFTQQDGLPSDLDNHVFKVKNQIVFATTAGIYEYDPARRGMVASPAYLNLFGKLPIRYLKEDGYGNLWFVQDKMVGVADFSTETPKLHYIPELNGKMVSGFEHIYPLSLQQVIMGSETGYYLINYLAYKQQLKPLQPYLTQAKAFGAFDSLLYGGYQFSTGSALPTHALPYVINAIHFAFAASTYAQSNSLEFSYFLEGFDKGWSAWSAKAEKDYTNLPAGKYKFHIKARTSPSHNSEVYSYTFSVQPPWYKSWWAYLLYTLLIGAALYGLLKLQARRYKKRQEKRRLADQLKFEEEQRRLAYQHQLEIEQSEKALIQLQNEKLEAEISHKNAELASATMNLVHKKEFIQKLKADVQQLQKTARVGDDNQELKKLLKVLNEEEKLDNEWEHFSQHFNSVHGDFLTKLKNKFPALKPHELQLCAYLRMNLTSKEIAPLMSISIRGVEISRYRLRKKLQLSTEENLAEFLSKV
ncbi:MAG TPA: triple tyrosine motif-containing protein, partial [Phnomibacter sp.]|nr:triple tyrosine motif-containing protein [Phnomibacter sp.]